VKHGMAVSSTLSVCIQSLLISLLLVHSFMGSRRKWISSWTAHRLLRQCDSDLGLWWTPSMVIMSKTSLIADADRPSDRYKQATGNTKTAWSIASRIISTFSWCLLIFRRTPTKPISPNKMPYIFPYWVRFPRHTPSVRS
jgi:hypothetical protein